MTVFNLNDLVLYGNNGVCRVEDVEQREDGTYYILVPVHKARTKLLVPLANEALVGRMRELPTPDDVQGYFAAAAATPTSWVTDSSARKEKARDVLNHGSEVDLLVLARTFTEHRDNAASGGRRPSSSDNALLRSALERLRNEFSLVLGVSAEEAEALIVERIAPAR